VAVEAPEPLLAVLARDEVELAVVRMEFDRKRAVLASDQVVDVGAARAVPAGQLPARIVRVARKADVRVDGGDRLRNGVAARPDVDRFANRSADRVVAPQLAIVARTACKVELAVPGGQPFRAGSAAAGHLRGGA